MLSLTQLEQMSLPQLRSYLLLKRNLTQLERKSLLRLQRNLLLKLSLKLPVLSCLPQLQSCWLLLRN